MDGARDVVAVSIGGSIEAIPYGQSGYGAPVALDYGLRNPQGLALDAAGDLLVGLMPMSIGMGLTFVPITLLGTGNVTNDDAGLASGLFNTAQQVGGALGLAVLSTLAASHTASLLHGGTGTAARFAALVGGYHVAFAGGAIVLGTGAVLLALGLRRRHVVGIDLTASPVIAA